MKLINAIPESEGSSGLKRSAGKILVGMPLSDRVATGAAVPDPVREAVVKAASGSVRVSEGVTEATDVKGRDVADERYR